MRSLSKAAIFCLAIFALGSHAMAQPAQSQQPAGQGSPPASDSALPAPPPGSQTSPDQSSPGLTTPASTDAAPSNPPMTGPKLLIATSMGDITVQLDSVRAPKSVANVLRYVREKHYDGTVVYRVAKGFVIQMGSFAAHGKGRGVHPGPVPLEADNGLHNVRGAVALAHGDAPDSATADFFIDVADNPALDKSDSSPGYAVFGQVIDGMAVVDQINQVPVGDDGPMKGQAPVDPILIKKVTIIGGSAPPKSSRRAK